MSFQETPTPPPVPNTTSEGSVIGVWLERDKYKSFFLTSAANVPSGSVADISLFLFHELFTHWDFMEGNYLLQK